MYSTSYLEEKKKEKKKKKQQQESHNAVTMGGTEILFMFPVEEGCNSTKHWTRE